MMVPKLNTSIVQETSYAPALGTVSVRANLGVLVTSGLPDYHTYLSQ